MAVSPKTLPGFVRSQGLDFPGGPVVKNLPADAGDTGLIPDPGRPHMLGNNQALAPQALKP